MTRPSSLCNILAIFKVLQQEISSLQEQITRMIETFQQTLNDVNDDSEDLMKQAITDLSERLRVLELQTKQKQKYFKDKDESWKDYKVIAYDYLLY